MPIQSQHLATTQKLAQKQVITQKLIQSIQLMAMPLAELKEAIHEEVERNPALEIVKEMGETDMPAETRLPDIRSTESDPFDNSSDPGYQFVNLADGDKKRQFLEGMLTQSETLGEHLVEQLHTSKIPGKLSSLAERVIGNLDGNGFHQEDPALLPEPGEETLLTEALDIVRSFDPIGCACSNWSESLVVQASIRGDGPEEFKKFVTQALPLLETQKPDEVRSSLGIAMDDWEDMYDYIRDLSPFPGRLYASDAAPYIIPDLEVRTIDGERVLILNDEVLPVLRVDPSFEQIDTEQESNAKRFISEHTQQARYFINSLAKRDNTLLKAAHSIVEFQRNFFNKGPRFLKPLTLKNIADAIGVHETTVSRITANKYIQTEWGMYELKYFFTNAISGSGSSASHISKVAAKEVIKEILHENSGAKRISDRELSNLLARRGINIARRTVTKYRKELDLPSSYRQ